MRIPAPKPPIDWEEVRRLYVEEGLTRLKVARELGYHCKTVDEVLRQHRIPRHQPKRRLRFGLKLYMVWKNMRGKCHNARHGEYPRYGGRGVGIHSDWEQFEVFHRWALRAGYRPGLVLTLFDPRRDFSPGNCVWSTRRERARRLFREEPPQRGHRVVAFGETKSVAGWAADPRCRVSKSGLLTRIEKGYTAEDAIRLPPGRGRTPLPARHGRPVIRPIRRAIDREKARQLHVEQGLSCMEVAQELGASYGGVWALLRGMGVYRRARVAGDPAYERIRQAWRKARWICARGDRNGKPRLHAAWQAYEPFRKWALRASWRPGLWLTLVDRQKGYSPSNCRWVKPEAVRERRRVQKHPKPRWTVRCFGEVKGPIAWSRDPRCQVSRSTLIRRLRLGWTPREAIVQPPQIRFERESSTPVEAFGQTKGLIEWTRDRRCRIGATGLRRRLLRGIPAEQAITTPPHQLWPDRMARPRRRTRGKPAELHTSARR